MRQDDVSVVQVGAWFICEQLKCGQRIASKQTMRVMRLNLISASCKWLASWHISVVRGAMNDSLYAAQRGRIAKIDLPFGSSIRHTERRERERSDATVQPFPARAAAAAGASWAAGPL